jgi:hypothetical protein
LHFGVGAGAGAFASHFFFAGLHFGLTGSQLLPLLLLLVVVVVGVVVVGVVVVGVVVVVVVALALAGFTNVVLVFLAAQSAIFL